MSTTLKTIFGTIAFLLLIPTAHSQQKTKNDSLRSIIEDSARSDFERSKAELEYAQATYIKTNPDSAILISSRVLGLANDYNYGELKAKALNLIAYAHIIKGQTVESDSIFKLAFAQAEQINSKKMKSDIYANWSRVLYVQGKFDESIAMLEKSQELFDSPDSLDYFLSSYALSNSYNAKGLFNEALKHSQKAGVFFKKTKNLEYIGAANLSMGTSYAQKGRIAEAGEAYSKSLTAFRKAGIARGELIAIMNAGIQFRDLANYASAESVYGRAIEIAKNEKLNYELAQSYQNLGAVYLDQLKIEQARKHFLLAQELSKEHDYKGLLNYVSASLGHVAFQEKDYDLAIDYFEKALSGHQNDKNLKGIVEGHNDLAKAQNAMGDFASALKNAEKALQLSGESENFSEKSDGNLYAYAAYKGLNQTDKALQALEKHKAIQDSLYKSENQSKLSDLRSQFRLEQRQLRDSLSFETEIAQQKVFTLQEEEGKKRTQLIAGCSILLLLLGGLLLFYRNKQKQKQLQLENETENERLALKAIQSEMKALRAQMNPHFLFNALGSIQSGLEKNETLRTKEYLSKFSKLMRMVLSNSQHQEIALQEEIKMLELYLELEQGILGKAVEYKIDLAGENVFDAEIPPLILQPFVENALKHGISSIDGKGQIRINFALQKNDLLCSIEDNGTGIDATQINNPGSMGLRITKDRLKMRDEWTERKATLTITNLATQEKLAKQGTLVQIYLPDAV